MGKEVGRRSGGIRKGNTKPGEVRDLEPSSARITRELIKKPESQETVGEIVKEAAKTAYEWTKETLKKAKDAVRPGKKKSKKPAKKKPAKRKPPKPKKTQKK